ncbi:MAG TPA: hypothetical protein VFC26_14790 [Verrucomicrobiae bacterium]|nr:hypothetical protein [Verrucomicrobiae bacterium]
MSRSPFRRPFQFAVALFLAMFLAFPVQAANLKLDAKLVWGSDEPSKEHKPVDPALAATLTNTFKWKHYYVITNVVTDIPSRETRKVKISEPCTIEITELEGPKIEVKVIGKGKPVSKTVKQIQKGEVITIGGDAENKCAWFIVITQLE